jgi:hypothetical protein
VLQRDGDERLIDLRDELAAAGDGFLWCGHTSLLLQDRGEQI